MAVLDLSYNTLGERRYVLNVNKEFVNKLAFLLPKLNLLQHLDLSCNGFNFKESKKISQALNDNHTMFGFHFSGNFGYTDEKGFLNVTSKNEKYFGRELLLD